MPKNRKWSLVEHFFGFQVVKRDFSRSSIQHIFSLKSSIKLTHPILNVCPCHGCRICSSWILIMDFSSKWLSSARFRFTVLQNVKIPCIKWKVSDAVAGRRQEKHRAGSGSQWPENEQLISLGNFAHADVRKDRIRDQILILKEQLQLN